MSSLFVHLLALAIGRVWVLRVYLAVPLSLVHLVDPTWIAASWDLTAGWRVPDRRQLRPWSRWVVLPAWGLVGVGRWFATSVGSARSLVINLALVVFFLLALFPLLSNFFEFCSSVLVGAKLMRVKRKHRISVGSIRLHAK